MPTLTPNRAKWSGKLPIFLLRRVLKIPRYNKHILLISIKRMTNILHNYSMGLKNTKNLFGSHL